MKEKHLSDAIRIQYYPSLEMGEVPHGFCDAGCDVSDKNLAKSSAALCEVLPISGICLLEQVHGNSVEEILDSSEYEQLQDKLASECYAFLNKGDAFFVRQNIGSSESRLMFAIRTADCCPVIVAGAEHIAVVHCGWRGLANKILDAVASSFRQVDDQPMLALVGPCAGEERYEVGLEVIEEIGRQARTRRENGKCFLSLQKTVRQQLVEFLGIENDQIHLAPDCTIASERYFSFRRQGIEAGRNLNYIVV